MPDDCSSGVEPYSTPFPDRPPPSTTFASSCLAGNDGVVDEPRRKLGGRYGVNSTTARMKAYLRRWHGPWGEALASLAWLKVSRKDPGSNSIRSFQRPRSGPSAANGYVAQSWRHVCQEILVGGTHILPCTDDHLNFPSSAIANHRVHLSLNQTPACVVVTGQYVSPSCR